MGNAPAKIIPPKFPKLPDGCDRVLVTVIMALPHQKARYYANDLLIGYEQWNRRHLRWLIDVIGAANVDTLSKLDPHFDLQRAKAVLEKHASSPGTGVEPEVDGLPEQWRTDAPKRIKLTKVHAPKIKVSPPLTPVSPAPAARIKVKVKVKVLPIPPKPTPFVKVRSSD